MKTSTSTFVALFHLTNKTNPTTSFRTNTLHLKYLVPNGKRNLSTRFFSSSVETQTCDDEFFMRRALSNAQKGYGNTYPNPAVGCVIVQQQDKTIIGEGFHPKAGLPHAEVFALFQAAGFVSSGVLAAEECTEETDSDLKSLVNQLSSSYCSEGGQKSLFDSVLTQTKCTAYVTLEPCSHHGRTPPCAASFVIAGVDRVVIGQRDINPKVNGGGVRILQEAGITVDFIQNIHLQNDCFNIIQYFLSRISTPKIDYEIIFDTGKKRRYLRSIAGKRKFEKTLVDMSLNSLSESSSLPPPQWLENADTTLWNDELLLLRMNSFAQSKKDTAAVGAVIAKELNAYVAQVIGRTVLLYRPASEPIIDIETQHED